VVSEVLFGQSYYLRFDPKLYEAMQPYPPLGTLYAASYLRTRGHDVSLFDAMLAESETEWDEALARERPRYAVLYEDNFNYLSKMSLLRMREAAFTMIAMAQRRGVSVIVCGSDASDHPREYLEQGADYILIGEGEHTLGELMDALTAATETSRHQIPGLAFVGDDEGMVDTGRQPAIKALDELPFPAWDLVDVDRYREVWRHRHGRFSMSMVTTRGCPYHCNWCAKPIWGQRYNARSPENVAQELRWLKATYHPDHIWFADDILGLKPRWLTRFADAVIEQEAQVPFKCLSRADLLLRDGDAEALARAGCEIVWIGAESGSQKILDAMEKGTKVEQIHEATRRLRDVGIKVGFFLQFGYPGEDREDIEKTLQMVRDCEPDDIGMSVSYPLPGTPFYERVKDQLGQQQNWFDSADMAMLYRGPYTTAFYRQLHTVLHKEFRARRYLAEMRHAGSRALRPRTLRHVARMVSHRLTLPRERRRLDRLAREPHSGVTPLSPVLDPSEAACPSPQDADGEVEVMITHRSDHA
jgi:radical SAM superfamily enzyme YgiQ (UPF0313 family)